VFSISKQHTQHTFPNILYFSQRTLMVAAVSAKRNVDVVWDCHFTSGRTPHMR
jgi:hypothetical protein